MIKRNCSTFQFWVSHIADVLGNFDLKICGCFSSPVLLHHRIFYCTVVCLHLARGARGCGGDLCFLSSLIFLYHRSSGSNLFYNSDFCFLNSAKFFLGEGDPGSFPLCYFLKKKSSIYKALMILTIDLINFLLLWNSGLVLFFF